MSIHRTASWSFGGVKKSFILRQPGHVDLILFLQLLPVTSLFAVSLGPVDGHQHRLPTGPKPQAVEGAACRVALRERVPQLEREVRRCSRFDEDIDGEVVEIAPVLAARRAEFDAAPRRALFHHPAGELLPWVTPLSATTVRSLFSAPFFRSVMSPASSKEYRRRAFVRPSWPEEGRGRVRKSRRLWKNAWVQSSSLQTLLRGRGKNRAAQTARPARLSATGAGRLCPIRSYLCGTRGPVGRFRLSCRRSP